MQVCVLLYVCHLKCVLNVRVGQHKLVYPLAVHSDVLECVPLYLRLQ